MPGTTWYGRPASASALIFLAAAAENKRITALEPAHALYLAPHELNQSAG